MTHFVWYLGREKREDIETLSINRVLRNIFMEKLCRKFASKASPWPHFNYGKEPKTVILCKKVFKNEIFWKMITKKALKS